MRAPAAGLLAAVLLFGLLACGGSGDGILYFPDVAYEPLTDADIELLVDVLPDVCDIAAHEAFVTSLTDSQEEGSSASLQKLVEGLCKLKDLRSFLVEEGYTVAQFRGALYRQLAAATALGFRQANIDWEELEQDEREGAEEHLRMLRETEAVVSRVPEANIEKVAEHIYEVGPYVYELMRRAPTR